MARKTSSRRALLRVLTFIAIPLVIISCAVAVNAPTARPFDETVFAAETGSPDAAGEDGKRIGTYVRIVDVGSALCVIAATRDRRHFVYDAGGIDQACLKAIREIVGDGSIELLVISHSDGRHMQDVPQLLGEFRVGEIWWTGYRRPQLSYRKTVRAIAEAEGAGAVVRNLRDSPIEPGTVFQLGDATVTFVAGWRSWPTTDDLDEAELQKAVSIVVSLDYRDASLLLTGDTIGRSSAWPADRCGFAEAAMISQQASVSLQADVLLAPNHGANNASSRCLIDAVQPTFVIFPAGHGDDQPSRDAAARYLDAGIPASSMLRTDRGDDEGAGEWDYLRSTDCRDQPGDDDVEVLMPDQGPPIVRYLRPNDVCVVVR